MPLPTLPRTGPPTNRDAATRHGFGGWLPLSMPDPTLAVTDPYLLRILLRAFLVAEMDAHPPGKAGVFRPHTPITIPNMMRISAIWTAR